MNRRYPADAYADALIGRRIVAVEDDPDGSEGLILTLDDGAQLAIAFDTHEGRIEFRYPASPRNEAAN